MLELKGTVRLNFKLKYILGHILRLTMSECQISTWPEMQIIDFDSRIQKNEGILNLSMSLSLSFQGQPKLALPLCSISQGKVSFFRETGFPIWKTGYPIWETGYPIWETRYPIKNRVKITGDRQ